ncbi:MAG: 50S ribosomal protein L24 [Candidatus Micrarchaeota archaeon]
MKSDTERKHFHKEKKHKRKKRLSVHLSKELRGKLKVKKRSLLLRKDDSVRVMRGPGKGKEGRVTRVSVMKRKVYVDGVTTNTAKGREILVALEASNLLLISLEATEERKKFFSVDVFKKPKAEKPKEKPAPKEKGEAKVEVKKVEKPEAQKSAPKIEAAAKSAPAVPGKAGNSGI